MSQSPEKLTLAQIQALTCKFLPQVNANDQVDKVIQINFQHPNTIINLKKSPISNASNYQQSASYAQWQLSGNRTWIFLGEV